MKATSFCSKTILVVDDSDTIRKEIRGALQAAGFAVVEACDGFEGIERIAQQRPNLVVLDVHMPRMNGLEMLERLMTDPSCLGLPVLMLTTEAQPSMVDRAKKAGAKGWMIKPVKTESLVSAV